MSNELIKKAYEHFAGVWPYGEDRSMVASCAIRSCYGIYSGGKEIFDRDMDSKREWQWVGTKADFDAYRESLREECKPEVGQECEFRRKTPKGELNFRKITPLYFGKSHFLYIDSDGLEEAEKHIEQYEFRPLKTESEKQADAMFDIVKDATDLYHACELLVKEGFKRCAG